MHRLLKAAKDAEYKLSQAEACHAAMYVAQALAYDVDALESGRGELPSEANDELDKLTRRYHQRRTRLFKLEPFLR